MTTTLSPEFLALQQLLAGRYSIERELGRGGMGIVLLARDVARKIETDMTYPGQIRVTVIRETRATELAR